MNVTQISIGRFHHFHLARQLERHGLLNSIWTGYPRFKLKDETGIPASKIKTFPWFQTPFMARGQLGLDRWEWVNKELAWQAMDTLDRFVASQLSQKTVLIALSCGGLHSGRVNQRRGGYYICDRGSTHIRVQDRLLHEEYTRWGLKFKGIDSRVIAKEETEYDQADYITVPSEFVQQSFIAQGIPPTKLIKIPYGARLDRFSKVAHPSEDTFCVLWVGGVSIRKGFLDLANAFAKFKHPRKELVVVGPVSEELRPLLRNHNLEKVSFLGIVDNQALPELYSSAHVFVLPSLEEGLAMVQGEALACGCPVIASNHTGAEDLFTSGVEGFIVPIRSPDAILRYLEELADDKDKRQAMSEAALKRIKAIGGWNEYGQKVSSLVYSFR